MILIMSYPNIPNSRLYQSRTRFISNPQDPSESPSKQPVQITAKVEGIGIEASLPTGLGFHTSVSFNSPEGLSTQPSTAVNRFTFPGF